MHALLAHAYHLARHILLIPLWRPLVAAMLVALGGRLLGLARGARGAALCAAAAVLAGWLVQEMGWLGHWPLPPVARLSGLALIMLADTMLRPSRAPWLGFTAAALAAWWLRGAPLDGPAILNCMPVFLGLAAFLPLARRLARDDTGWGGVAAALSLAVGLSLAGAASHWARAALVPGVVALVLLRRPGAAPALAGMITVLAAAALVASNRGRVLPVDLACLVPLLAWGVVARFFGPAEPPRPPRGRRSDVASPRPSRRASGRRRGSVRPGRPPRSGRDKAPG